MNIARIEIVDAGFFASLCAKQNGERRARPPLYRLSVDIVFTPKYTASP